MVDLIAVHLDLIDIDIPTIFVRRPVGSPYLTGSVGGVVFDIFDNDCSIYYGPIDERIGDVVQRHRRTPTEVGR